MIVWPSGMAPADHQWKNRFPAHGNAPANSFIIRQRRFPIRQQLSQAHQITLFIGQMRPIVAPAQTPGFAQRRIQIEGRLIIG